MEQSFPLLPLDVIKILAFIMAIVDCLTHNPKYLTGGSKELTSAQELFDLLQAVKIDTADEFFSKLINTSKKGIWNDAKHHFVKKSLSLECALEAAGRTGTDRYKLLHCVECPLVFSIDEDDEPPRKPYQ